MTPIPENKHRQPDPLNPPELSLDYFRLERENIGHLYWLRNNREEVKTEERVYSFRTEPKQSYGPFPSVSLPVGNKFVGNLVRFSLEGLEEDKPLFNEFGLDISWNEEKQAVDVVLLPTGKAISVFCESDVESTETVSHPEGIIRRETKKGLSERARAILGALLVIPEDWFVRDFDGVANGYKGSIWDMVLSGKTLKRLELPLPFDERELNEEAFYFVDEETAKEALKRGARPIVVEEKY